MSRMARCMLNEKHVPSMYWGEAVLLYEECPWQDALRGVVWEEARRTLPLHPWLRRARQDGASTTEEA